MDPTQPTPPKTEKSRPNPTQPNPLVNPAQGQLWNKRSALYNTRVPITITADPCICCVLMYAGQCALWLDLISMMELVVARSLSGCHALSLCCAFLAAAAAAAAADSGSKFCDHFEAELITIIIIIIIYLAPWGYWWHSQCAWRFG